MPRIKKCPSVIKDVISVELEEGKNEGELEVHAKKTRTFISLLKA